MIKTTITFPESAVIQARDALLDAESRLRNFARGWFENLPLYTIDAESATEIDPDGNFTGLVAGRVLRLNMHFHVAGIASQILTDAVITHKIATSVEGEVETIEDDTDAHLADFGQRRPGRKYGAYGAFSSDGTKPGQAVNLPGTIVNQWNKTIKFRNLNKDASAGTVTIKSGGDYSLESRISYDKALSQGITWTYGATVNGSSFGQTKTTNNGNMSGKIKLIGLNIFDVVGVGVQPSSTGATFKVINARARIARDI